VVLVSPFYRAAHDDFDWPAISYYLNDFHRILAAGIRVRDGGRIDPDLRENMARRVRDRIGPYGWTRFFEAYLETPALPLDRVHTPILIISGARDFAAFPADTEALRAVLPNCRAHILPDRGHFPMVEGPAEFGRLVDDFLRTPGVIRPAVPADRPARPVAATRGFPPMRSELG
jgi:pimeloyl-ACP methyl ester carboxylesterase